MTARVWEPKFKIPKGALINPHGVDHQGILTWKNPKNGFLVAAIHYTSDPRKRTEEWLKEETKLLQPHQIEREYEIDFASRAGKKAFGYLLENPKRFRVPDFDLAELGKKGTFKGKTYRIIAALDYGSTNPTSIHFYAIDNRRRMTSVYEFYKPSNAREIAKVLQGKHPDPKYRHPLWERCERVVVDGAIFNKNQEDQNQEGMRSIGDLLEDNDIHTMERATKDRLAGLDRLHDMFAPSELDGLPSLYFCYRCVEQWKEFTSLVYAETPAHQLLNKNAKEDIVEKDDHAYDETRYAVMSIQAPSSDPEPPQPGDGTLGAVEDEMDLDDDEETEVDYL